MKTVTENNKLIAEFMGKEVITEKDFLAYNYEELKDNMYIDTTLKYHSSFDWLMEVVEKVENLHEANNVLIGTNLTYIQIHNKATNEQETFKGVGQTKIEAVYNAVVAFIEWYNSAGKEN